MQRTSKLCSTAILLFFLLFSTFKLYSQGYSSKIIGKTWYFPVRECYANSNNREAAQTGYYHKISFLDKERCRMNDHDGTYTLDRNMVTITNAQTRLFNTYYISECTANFIKIKDKDFDGCSYLGIAIPIQKKL